MNIIFQGRFPVRTIVLIGVALLITTQIYAQNAEARLSLTLRNATLKEFVKRIENSTGYSFIYGEEIIIKHKINLQVKDKPLREILDLVFKNEQISYQLRKRALICISPVVASADHLAVMYDHAADRRFVQFIGFFRLPDSLLHILFICLSLFRDNILLFF